MNLKIWIWSVVLLLGADAHADIYKRTLPGGIRVTVVDGPFDRSLHSIKDCGQADTCLIDNVPPLSTIGLPTTEIKSITVNVGGRNYVLPSDRMFDPGLDPRSGGIERFAGFCSDRFNCAFRARFSEAGGAYAAEWLISGGVPIRTVLSASIDISGLFAEHPSPPKEK